MKKTRIFIVRHTETIGNVEKRLAGRKDYEITENGEKLIDKLTRELRNVKFDKIYSSKSQRAIKTVHPLAILNKLEIEELEELQEMDFGIYDGWKWEDINKIHPEINQTKNKINEICGIPEQETMEQVAERMYKCITEIALSNIGNTILISSHGVAIEAFLRKILKKPFKEDKETLCQHNVAINELEFENNNYNIIQLSNVKYLKKY